MNPSVYGYDPHTADPFVSGPKTPLETLAMSTQAGGGKAVISLVLGIVGMLAWLLPIIGLPVAITGLVLGVRSMNSVNKGMATAGLTLSIIGVVLSIINASIGAYMGATGQM